MFKWLEYENTTIKRFKINKLLGTGSFSKVYKAYDNLKKREIALKKINTILISNSENEINILKNLRYKEKNYITKLYESFNYDDNLFIVYKLYDISLTDYIKHTDSSIDKTFKFIKQITQGLLYLQNNKIIHRDLKPDNILLKNSLHEEIIIIDFGISTFNNAVNIIDTVIQTIYYRAPEVFLKSNYDFNIDIWSLGCIAYEIYYKKPLFNNKTPTELFIHQNIILDHPPLNMIKKFKHIHCFYDNIKNPTYIKYDNTIYVFKYYNFLKIHKQKRLINFVIKCCEWDPQKRLYAKEILSTL